MVSLTAVSLCDFPCLLVAFPHVCLTLSLSACLRLEGLAIKHNTYSVDRRRPAKNDETRSGKRLLLCQERVNLKYVRFESKNAHLDERYARAKDA